MSLTIILAGIPGSGKSTVLEETIKIFPSLTVINYGDMMLKEALSQNIDKDSLRKLPLFQQQKIGIQAAKKMAANMPKIACIDTHAMIKTPHGYCPGMPDAVVKILNPNVIGMIECPPSLIYERRKNDQTRKRDNESLEQIEYHQQISRSFLLACTAVSKALYVPIQNHAMPSEGARQLVYVIEDLLP
jgi:adenylate kinase